LNVNINAPKLVGKTVKDENNREIGRIVSFLIDSSGRAEEVLIENRFGRLTKYPVSMLKTEKDEVFLVSSVDRMVEMLSERLPTIQKKRRILDRLQENRVIPPEIYENLCKEFDKALKDMRNEARSLLEDMDKQIKAQEEKIKTLQLARAFLEIEHGIGTVEDDVYKQSIVSLLKEVKTAQQKKLSLLRTKDKLASILQEKKEPEKKPETQGGSEREPEKESEPAAAEAGAKSGTESKETTQAVPVRVTQG